MTDSMPVEKLYQHVVNGWNALDADRIAAAFSTRGLLIGYDGSEMRGSDRIASGLGAIFQDHEPGRWVALVQQADAVSTTVQLLRAHSAWIMAPDQDPFPMAVQAVFAILEDDEWRIALLQTTPAAWHGRPEEAADLARRLGQAAAQDR